MVENDVIEVTESEVLQAEDSVLLASRELSERVRELEEMVR